MNRNNLVEAIFEADRFIKKAEKAIERFDADKYNGYGCKEMAAAKRSSMDLTRALVGVRRHD